MTTPPRLLVTGAGGFVCSNIITILLDYGYHIVALDRYFDAALTAEWLSRWPEQIELVEGESTSLHNIQADAILHGAAVTAGPEDLDQTPEDNFRANLEPMLAALDWSRQQGNRRAILVSSSAVFSKSEGEITEDTPSVPRGIYAVAKQSAESLTQTLFEEYAGDVVTVRLSSIYGLSEQARPSRPRTSPVNVMLQTALETGTITVYRDSLARDWTFAPDLGHVLHQLLSRPKLQHALYNLASGERLTSLQIAQAIQAVLPDVELKVVEEPDPKMVAFTRRGWLSNQRLRQETGFDRWTPFAQGIRHVIDECLQVKVVK